MLQHLELYSGIGGMRLSVSCVLPPQISHICTAIDVNTVANRAYQHAFGDLPRTVSLEYSTVRDLQFKSTNRQQHEAPEALLWTLSPPCQPFTTTSHSKQQGHEDTRAASFNHLLHLMTTLPPEHLPTHVLLENVINFYNSRSWLQLREVLLGLGYSVFDVALCPSQLGLPHRRPRHYTLAKAGGQPFSAAAAAQLQQLQHSGNSAYAGLLEGCTSQPLQPFLELDWSQQLQPLALCQAAIQAQVARFALPISKVARYCRVFDIVTPKSQHSNCVTKSYGKNIMGCGSFVMEEAAAQQLATQDSRGRWHLREQAYSSSSSSSSQTCDNTGTSSTLGDDCPAGQPTPCCQQQQQQQQQVVPHEEQLPPVLRVRAFTPREVANLQGFPQWFTFPDDFSDRQAYALLGNSLSIDAVSHLARLLLEDVIGAS